MRPGSSIIWLLELEIPGGETYHLSTEPISLANGTTAIQFEGGLSSVRYDDSIDILRVEPADPAASVEGFLPDTLAELWQRGIDLGECMGTLSWVEVYRGVSAQDYKGRHLVVSGRIDSPARGDVTKGVRWFSASIEATPQALSGTLIDRQAVITEDDFPEVALSANRPIYGTPFPLVIGAPGDSLNGYASPGYYLTYRPGPTYETDILIAIGHVGGTTVVVQDEIGGSDTFTIQHGMTDSGIPYSYVINDTTGVGPSVYTASLSYFVKWSNAYGTTEVANGPFGGSVADAILYLLRRAGAKVNIGRSMSALQRLAGVAFNVYLNDPSVSAWEYLSTKVLPALPITVKAGPKGLELLFIDPTIPKGTEAADIHVAREGWLLASSLVSERVDAPSRVSVQAGIDLFVGYLAAEYRVPLGEGTIQSARNATRAQAMGLSQRETVVLDAPWADDATSANLIATAYLAAKTGQQFSATYSAPIDWHHLECGDIIRVTDDSLGLSSVPAVIVRKSWDGATWAFSLLLYGSTK